MRDKILVIVLASLLAFSSFSISVMAGTIEIITKDAKTGVPVNATIYLAEEVDGRPDNVWNNNFVDVGKTNDQGVYYYSNASNTTGYFFKAVGEGNYSILWGTWEQMRITLLDPRGTGKELKNITRYDVSDVEGYNIRYVNGSWVTVEAPIPPAYILNISTPSPARFLAKEPNYEFWSYGYSTTEKQFTESVKIAPKPMVSFEWNKSNIFSPPGVDPHMNITNVYVGDDNQSLIVIIELEGEVNQSGYEYKVYINVSKPAVPNETIPSDYLIKYNGSDKTPSQLLNTSSGWEDAPSLEKNVHTINSNNITFIIDRAPLSKYSEIGIIAAANNGSDEVRATGGAIYQNYTFTTQYSPQRLYQLNVTTDALHLYISNTSGYVSYINLNPPHQKGGVYNIPAMLQKGVEVIFDITNATGGGKGTGGGGEILIDGQDIEIEIRNSSTNDDSPFSDSLIVLVRDYNQTSGFFEKVFLPPGEYDFLFKTREHKMYWNKSVVISGPGPQIVKAVMYPKQLSTQEPSFFIDDFIREGENITGRWFASIDLTGLNASYYIYPYGNTTLVDNGALDIQALQQGTINVVSNLAPGKYMFIVALKNESQGTMETRGEEFVVSSKIYFDPMGPPRPAAPSTTFKQTIRITNGTYGVAGINVTVKIRDPDLNFDYILIAGPFTTDSDGLAEIKFTAPSKAGFYPMEIIMEGEGKYAREWFPLMVQDFKLQVDIDKMNYLKDESITFRVYAKEFNGTPIQGVKITGVMHNFTQWEPGEGSASNTTDANGMATLTFSPPAQNWTEGFRIVEISAEKDKKAAFEMAFFNIAEYFLTLNVSLDTPPPARYMIGQIANVTVQVSYNNGTGVEGLTFYNGSMKEFMWDSPVAFVAGATTFGPALNLSDTGGGIYRGTLDTGILKPGFYTVVVLLFGSEPGPPLAEDFADFEVSGTLNLFITTPNREMFEPYRLNDVVNITIYVTNLTGDPVNGTLNYKVGKPWEIFAPPEAGFRPPRKTGEGLSIVGGEVSFNFILDNNFTGNETPPMEKGKREIIGAEPFLLYVEANTSSGDMGVDVLPIFMSDLRVRVQTDKAKYNVGDNVIVTINITSTSGDQVNATIATPTGKENYITLFGPEQFIEIPVTPQGVGYYNATFQINHSGEFFVFAAASNTTFGIGGSGNRFIVESDIIQPTLSTDKDEYTAGDTISVTVGGTIPSDSQIEIVLFNPSYRIINKSTSGTTASFTLSGDAEPGTYSLRATVTDSNGNTGIAEKGILVRGSTVNASLVITVNGTSRFYFSKNDTMNITLYIGGGKKATVKIYSPSGDLIAEEAAVGNGDTRQFTVPSNAETGIYYVRADTKTAVGIASTAFEVVG